MKAAVFFATREGQTRKIAERVASDLEARDMEVDLHDVRRLRAPIDWPAAMPRSSWRTMAIKSSTHGLS